MCNDTNAGSPERAPVNGHKTIRCDMAEISTKAVWWIWRRSVAVPRHIVSRINFGLLEGAGGGSVSMCQLHRSWEEVLKLSKLCQGQDLLGRDPQWQVTLEDALCEMSLIGR